MLSVKLKYLINFFQFVFQAAAYRSCFFFASSSACFKYPCFPLSRMFFRCRTCVHNVNILCHNRMFYKVFLTIKVEYLLELVSSPNVDNLQACSCSLNKLQMGFCFNLFSSLLSIKSESSDY